MTDEERLQAYREAAGAAYDYQKRKGEYDSRIRDIDSDTSLDSATKESLKKQAAENYYGGGQDEARATLALGAEFGEKAAKYKGEQERATIGKGAEETRAGQSQLQEFKQRDEERDYQQSQRGYRF
jgi:hypothetical protein